MIDGPFGEFIPLVNGFAINRKTKFGELIFAFLQIGHHLLRRQNFKNNIHFIQNFDCRSNGPYSNGNLINGQPYIYIYIVIHRHCIVLQYIGFHELSV